uniref:Uncharacterized protein n=1 Tax=Anguilla anguilla TaxID=7936 RepID=A0A0E9XHD1_ANGAN
MTHSSVKCSGPKTISVLNCERGNSGVLPAARLIALLFRFWGQLYNMMALQREWAICHVHETAGHCIMDIGFFFFPSRPL